LDNIVIRQVKMKDAYQLHKNVFFNNRLFEVKSSIQISLSNTRKKKGFRFVAVFSNEVIGNVEIIFNTHPLMKHRALIYSLVVSQNRRRCGVGKLLVDECIKLADNYGIRIVTLSVRGGTDAEKFYKSVGFKKYGELPNGIEQLWDGKQYDECLYYKHIEN